MSRSTGFMLRHRALVGGASLIALGGYLAAAHQPSDAGVSADEITPELINTIAAELGDAEQWQTGAWVLDFVDPQQGEGGSEEAIAQLAAEMDALPGVTVERAGFYSEDEHLFLLHGSPDDLAPALANLDDPLIEGYEPELVYSLPEQAMSAADVVLDEGSELEPHKPSRFQPNDPMFRLQWHMEQIRAPEAWVESRGKGTVVAVIDTGVAWKDATGAKALPDLAGIKFVDGESFVTGGLPEGLDDHAHGSHVAGTIAQATNNGIGVTGVAFESTIMPLKVLSRDGRGSVPGIANAIRYAADHGAHVINMSLGGPLPSRVLAKAIEYAHEKGVTVVCAAGNEKRSRVGYPAANEFSIAVSATDYSKGLAFYSNWGKDIDVSAPGGDSRADRNGDGAPDGVLQNTIKIQKPLENDYLFFQGTSMASPHAAGVAALIVGEGVTNPDEVERILKATANNPTGATWDERYGAGIVDAKAASAGAHATYAPERAGLAGALGLLGLAGFGVAAGASRRRKIVGAAGLAAGVLIGSGALGLAPVAYGVAGGLAAFGSPLWLSAALPVLATLLLLGFKPLRGLLTGLSLGYAAMLLHGAIVLPTLLTDLPGGPMVDRLWLGLNAVISVWLAHRTSRLRS